jgi:hypothetical protein
MDTSASPLLILFELPNLFLWSVTGGVIQLRLRQPRPSIALSLTNKAESQRISSLNLYYGCIRSPKSFHCSRADEETTRIFDGNAKLEVWKWCRSP